jgi:hypothetical protein
MFLALVTAAGLAILWFRFPETVDAARTAED